MSRHRFTALVCDDHGSRVEDWRTTAQLHLGAEWNVIPVGGEELSTMVDALSLMEVANVAGQANDSLLKKAHKTQVDLLNRADLVIFDSDLTPSLEDSEKHTPEFSRTLRNQMGDTVARQIRTFTEAGFITVVNMFWGNYPGDRVFDLTLMLGQNSHADLHLSEDELSNAALWTGVSDDGDYHPWHWPVLARAHEIVRRAEGAVTDLDAKVVDVLGFDISTLASKQLDLLGGDPAITFRGLTKTAMGYRYKEGSHDDETHKRMAASVLRRWLARVVVVGQNAISDGPHVLTRFSPVLADEESNLDAWKPSLGREWPDTPRLRFAEEARVDSLQPFVDRPVYSVNTVREAIGRQTPTYLDPPEVNFAEDLSEFISFDDGTDFETDVPGPYFRRFVAEVDDVDYEPSPRLLK